MKHEKKLQYMAVLANLTSLFRTTAMTSRFYSPGVSTAYYKRFRIKTG
jgi:hypothetical protein